VSYLPQSGQKQTFSDGQQNGCYADLLAVRRDREISGFVSAAFGTKGGNRTFAACASQEGVNGES